MARIATIGIVLALCSYVMACMGTRPCHDGPQLPYSSLAHHRKTYPLRKSLFLRSNELYEFLEARGYFDDGLHARDADSFGDVDETYVNFLPTLPSGVDPRGQHMFVRLNAIPKAYPAIGKVDHSGLNKLMFDLGGQHVDLVCQHSR